MKKVSIIASAVSAALLSGSAFAVDFHGYMRAGVGMNVDGGQQKGYEKQRIGRLGNEADTYGEITLGDEVYNQDGASFYVNTMTAYSTNGSNDWEGTQNNGLDDDNDARFAIRQANVQAKGVLGFAPEATLWAGKRYYQRHNIHHSDLFYWNISGAGAGIENMEVGEGKLSVAWVRNDTDRTSSGQFKFEDEGNNGKSLNVNIFDVRYAGIELSDNTKLELGVDYAFVNETDYATSEPDDGVLLNAELTYNLDMGYNKTVIQFGTEGYSSIAPNYGGGKGYDANAKEDAVGYRIINWGVTSFGDNVEMLHQLIYGEAEDYAYEAKNYSNGRYQGSYADATTISAVIRPVYKWDDHHKSILELGYSYDDVDTVGEDKRTKVTIAQAWSAGSGIFARPEIRLYATYLKADLNDNSSDVFKNGGDDDTFQFGVQAEAWF